VYGYAGGNPLAYVDPDGRQIVIPGPLLPPLILLGGSAYLWCQLNPEACKKLKNWCERQISGGGGGGGGGDKGGDCREVKRKCIEVCTDQHVGKGRFYDIQGSKFQKCLMDCMAINGC